MELVQAHAQWQDFVLAVFHQLGSATKELFGIVHL
jgi:hypothetical protein